MAVPPPGRLVDIGHRRLHIFSQGEDSPSCQTDGSPSVVLEAGIAASSLSWSHVQPRVAAFARTYSYDRAGLAWSDPCARPVTAASCADDLHRLLEAAEVKGPYVLVGHSYGAFVLQVYASRHPDNVAGLVLVDPIYPDEWLNLPRRERWRLKGGVFLSRLGAVLAKTGVVRACLSLLARGSTRVPRRVSRIFGSEAARVLDRLAGEVQKLPAETWPAVQAHWSEPKCFTSMAEHLAGLRKSAAEVARCGDIRRDIPVVILSAATQSEAYRQEHARMAARSAHGRHVVASGSGHWILLDEPDLVVDAIRGVVARAYSTGRSATRPSYK
jgi:pimeloyl-ACP methyl ester carboxylesterase